ncbi:MAG: CdvA-like protein [Thaumarchaeota archaeon]|nr:CdvA-like protein [Nitrososphaerota archaeon]MCY3975677.1 CdvA-like protein [Nitrososphaerota archaeon]
MNSTEVDIIGKIVKDMYGTFIGKAIGSITDIDGTIQNVGIDCGSYGLKQIKFDQLVIQGDVIIFIPKWRLDAQRLIREKRLTLRRLKALIDIVSENDEMKEDAKIIHEKYKSKLESLDDTEKQLRIKLNDRLNELNEQIKTLKLLLFDAKVQYKSNEIDLVLFESIKSYNSDLIEHINHEIIEITNIQRRITELTIDNIHEEENKQSQIQESAISYLDSSKMESETKLKFPEVPQKEPKPIMQQITNQRLNQNNKTNMEQQNKHKNNNDEKVWVSN